MAGGSGSSKCIFYPHSKIQKKTIHTQSLSKSLQWKYPALYLSGSYKACLGITSKSSFSFFMNSSLVALCGPLRSQQYRNKHTFLTSRFVQPSFLWKSSLWDLETVLSPYDTIFLNSSFTVPSRKIQATVTFCCALYRVLSSRMTVLKWQER